VQAAPKSLLNGSEQDLRKGSGNGEKPKDRPVKRAMTEDYGHACNNIRITSTDASASSIVILIITTNGRKHAAKGMTQA
jgi:hypothetical protein